MLIEIRVGDGDALDPDRCFLITLIYRMIRRLHESEKLEKPDEVNPCEKINY